MKWIKIGEIMPKTNAEISNRAKKVWPDQTVNTSNRSWHEAVLLVYHPDGDASIGTMIKVHVSKPLDARDELYRIVDALVKQQEVQP